MIGDLLDKIDTVKMMYLENKGWKVVATQRGKYHCINYWTHDNHQPPRRGYFTQTQAVDHQKYVDKVGHCTCIPKEQPR
jgi:hypothetical protein